MTQPEKDLSYPSSAQVAVALSYQQGEGAPRVVAKGRGHVAENIVSVAEQAGVPVEHNPGLAQVLSQLELEQAIPRELYKAVAEVIAFLIRNGRKT
jgi:flagellar biosynthesis protein